MLTCADFDTFGATSNKITSFLRDNTHSQILPALMNSNYIQQAFEHRNTKQRIDWFLFHQFIGKLFFLLLRQQMEYFISLL